MENTALISKEFLDQAERILNSLSYPIPQFSVNMHILPVYLGTIFPFHPLTKILKDLNLIKVLNYV